jgi:predicted RNase H-like nuclease
MKQSTSGRPVGELNDQQLSQVTGGVTPEEVQRVADETLARANEHADQAAQHHGASVKARALSAIGIDFTDFGSFTAGGIVANAAVPKKKKGS